MFSNLRYLLCGLLPFLSALVFAQTDEIQVYDASIAETGQFDLTVHSNYTPDGRTKPDFPGGVVPQHSVNGAFEFAYGVNKWWELGLYAPVYTITSHGDLDLDGIKLRSLFVVPDAWHQRLFYGVNFELSYNKPQWNTTPRSLEMRPIVGWHLGQWDLIFNPIFDSNFDGVGSIHFAPAERLAYNASEKVVFGLELYSDFGPMRHVPEWSDQSQTLFAITDYAWSEENSMEFGVGYGLTPQSDRVVLKLIWNHAL
jgi:hypothetical protein